jgi:hypothetical protein
LERADKIKKTIARPDVKQIIEFIKNNEGTTSRKVIAELKTEGIASRITTISMINALLEHGIIKDERKGTYSHKLKYNEDFDWEDLVINLLTSSLDEIKGVNREADKTIEEIKDYVLAYKTKTKHFELSELKKAYGETKPKHKHETVRVK